MIMPIAGRKFNHDSSLVVVAVSAMLPLAKQCAFEEPCIETITGENVLTWPHVVRLQS